MSYEVKPEAPVAAAPETAKAPPSYLTVRTEYKKLDQSTGELSEAHFSRVLFFNGGKDRNGNPIFNNQEKDKPGVVGFVTSKGRLAIYNTDVNGHMSVDADGKVAKSVASHDLSRFVAGFEAGTESKGLKAKEATISGPYADEIAGMFKSVTLKVEAAKKAAPSM